MTVTLNLPPDVERALLAEASARGLSLDEFLSQMVISHASAPEGTFSAVVISEDGIPVLRTGHPLSVGMVDAVAEAVRTEREQDILGQKN